MPLLTIITVTYNAEKYLGRTLDSVRAALSDVDKRQVEYLVVDGASNDRTMEIAESYSGIITKVFSEPDEGLYDAMNKGLRQASGKFVWFLNAGDEIYDSSVLSKFFRESKSNADVYFSDAMLVREDGTEVGLRSKFTPHNLPENLKWQDFSFGMKVCHQAFIAKKSIAPKFLSNNLSADIDWEIACLKKAKNVQFLGFVLCRYLLGGLSVKNHRRSLIDRFIVLKTHFGFITTIWNHLLIFYRGIRFARQYGKYW